MDDTAAHSELKAAQVDSRVAVKALLWSGFVLAAGCRNAHAQTDQQRQALALISSFAKEMCDTPPLQQTNGSTSLSGNASAKLNGIIGKVVDLGIGGAAEYKQGQSNGVLQADLATAINNGNQCRITIIGILVPRLLGTPPPPPPHPPPHPQSDVPTVEGVALGADKDTLHNDANLNFEVNNQGHAYATKLFNMPYGSGLSSHTLRLKVDYFYDNDGVYDIRIIHASRGVCDNSSAPHALMGKLASEFGSAVDGPVTTQTHPDPGTVYYSSIDEETTKALFRQGNYEATYSATSRVSYPSNSALSNKLSCDVIVDYTER